VAPKIKSGSKAEAEEDSLEDDGEDIELSEDEPGPGLAEVEIFDDDMEEDGGQSSALDSTSRGPQLNVAESRECRGQSMIAAIGFLRHLFEVNFRSYIGTY